MKKDYKGLSVIPILLFNETSLLTGSITTTKVAVHDVVTVEDYDFGFADEDSGDTGFDVNFGD